ncbi:hypothetical protein [Rhizobium sp. GN54]|uniref:hypothetical protein n=1 Tax=Rhizobium sp. GN54 TaxID=2898150 RepID=UPI001E33D26C|nr:hypothetical protein [Rhizobium sp. GN54]MCD2183313.1 hypothetical protein [Rhizobium sp. GN54]
MIVKAHKDGSYYVADNGNWRLAGPFISAREAWSWIDAHRPDHATEPENPKEPRLVSRHKRSDQSVAAMDVLRVVPIILEHASSSVKEREFALGMKNRASRTRPLRLTPKQAAWWHRLEKKYGGTE